jgi:hypothetical protein
MLKMLATEHLQNSRAKYKPIISGTASPSWVCWTPFAVYKHGQAELSELGEQLRSIGLPERITLDYAKESAKLFSDCKVSEKYPGFWSRPVSLMEIRQKRNEFISVLQKAIDRIREAGIR